jgi:hypothetical protein
MAGTLSLYSHTVNRFSSGANAVSDTYKINLYSAFTFDPTATTKAAAEVGATQLATANGYTQDSKALTGVAINIVTTDDSVFTADNVSWSASGGDIGPATHALLYNDTDTDDPPVLCFAFGEAKTANTGTPFNINWNATGIILWSYTAP